MHSTPHVYTICRYLTEKNRIVLIVLESKESISFTQKHFIRKFQINFKIQKSAIFLLSFSVSAILNKSLRRFFVSIRIQPVNWVNYIPKIDLVLFLKINVQRDNHQLRRTEDSLKKQESICKGSQLSFFLITTRWKVEKVSRGRIGKIKWIPFETFWKMKVSIYHFDSCLLLTRFNYVDIIIFILFNLQWRSIKNFSLEKLWHTDQQK